MSIFQISTIQIVSQEKFDDTLDQFTKATKLSNTNYPTNAATKRVHIQIIINIMKMVKENIS
jgi:hypothetical protein